MEWLQKWPNHMNNFENCVHEINLVDLKFKGVFHTWFTNNNGCPSRKKLNRALVNPSWINEFPRSESLFLSQLVSDHTAILVNLFIAKNEKPIPFKYFNHWCDNGYKKVVYEAWRHEVGGNKMFFLFQAQKY